MCMQLVFFLNDTNEDNIMILVSDLKSKAVNRDPNQTCMYRLTISYHHIKQRATPNRGKVRRQ